jgi:hypothetical protein
MVGGMNGNSGVNVRRLRIYFISTSYILQLLDYKSSKLRSLVCFVDLDQP